MSIGACIVEPVSWPVRFYLQKVFEFDLIAVEIM